MWWRELGEVENEWILHNLSLFVIFVPKIVKIGGSLTKFRQNNFAVFFWDTVYNGRLQRLQTMDKIWAVMFVWRLLELFCVLLRVIIVASRVVCTLVSTVQFLLCSRFKLYLFSVFCVCYKPIVLTRASLLVRLQLFLFYIRVLHKSTDRLGKSSAKWAVMADPNWDDRPHYYYYYYCWNTVSKLMCLQQKASHQTSMHCACKFFVNLGCDASPP